MEAMQFHFYLMPRAAKNGSHTRLACSFFWQTLRIAVGLGILSAIFVALPSFAEDVPFAAPPLPGPGEMRPTPSSLSDIMGKTQVRHIKLWYAIQSKNWDLVNYELGHLRDTFESAVILYQNIPVEYIVSADKPLVALEDALKSRDSIKLQRSFGDLTAACNTCHRAAQIGYIIIQTPTSLPFSNQQFLPKNK